MSSWSMPSPETPIAPTSTPLRKTGTLPAKIWMPFGNSARPVQPVPLSPAASDATSLAATRSSCSPVLNGLQLVIGGENGPLPVPKMPSGKYGRARLPTARLLYAMPLARAVGSLRKTRVAGTYAAIDDVVGGVVG